jgi:hypothetical protein
MQLFNKFNNVPAPVNFPKRLIIGPPHDPACPVLPVKGKTWLLLLFTATYMNLHVVNLKQENLTGGVRDRNDPLYFGDKYRVASKSC